jgi:hypothetical protein
MPTPTRRSPTKSSPAKNSPARQTTLNIPASPSQGPITTFPRRKITRTEYPPQLLAKINTLKNYIIALTGIIILSTSVIFLYEAIVMNILWIGLQYVIALFAYGALLYDLICLRTNFIPAFCYFVALYGSAHLGLGLAMYLRMRLHVAILALCCFCFVLSFPVSYLAHKLYKLLYAHDQEVKARLEAVNGQKEERKRFSLLNLRLPQRGPDGKRMSNIPSIPNAPGSRSSLQVGSPRRG